MLSFSFLSNYIISLISSLLSLKSFEFFIIYIYFLIIFIIITYYYCIPLHKLHYLLFSEFELLQNRNRISAVKRANRPRSVHDLCAKPWDHILRIWCLYRVGLAMGLIENLGALYAATTTVFFPIKRISLNRVWKGISLNRENDIKVIICW